MGRWVVFFVFIFICGTLIAGSVDTYSTYAVTRLDGSIGTSDTTISVDSTTNFPASTAPDTARRFVIDSEMFQYTNKTSNSFTGVSRGVSDPQTGSISAVASHSDSAKVMSLTASTISSIGAINLISSGVSFGSIAGYIVSGTALRDIFKTLSWDYPWFQGNLVYARLPLFAFSAGFLWALAIIFITLAQGILSAI